MRSGGSVLKLNLLCRQRVGYVARRVLCSNRSNKVSNTELAIRFFLQLAVILGVCRLVGFLARKIGQPQVVGEMIAGVLMGPSLFGLLLPDWQHQLFPTGAAMSILYASSQVGLVLYMFLIGVEFDTNLIRRRLRSAVSVSLAGILTPLVLGSLLALLLVGRPGFFSSHVVPWEAMLFMGAAIAITAFPMLARIIFERGMAGTSLGTLALAAGSTDDAISWCLLAVVLAVFKQNALIFFSSRRRHTISDRDWSSDVCSSDLKTESSAFPFHSPQLRRVVRRH